MRVMGRWLLVILTVALGVAATAEHSWAAFSGGSRLLMYFTQRSLLNPDAGNGSAITVIGITNQSADTPTRVAVTVVSPNCANTNPVSFPLLPRQTVRLAVSDLATPTLFPEGFVDVRAVNNDGADIRFDQLGGKILVVDTGGPRPVGTAYTTAALFSDDSRAEGQQQGGLVVDKAHPRTMGLFQGSVEFWGVGGPFGTQNRLILIPVSANPGTPPNADNPSIDFFSTSGGPPVLQVEEVPPTCMVASPLAALHPEFAAKFGGTGSLGEGGNLRVEAGGLGNKGFVGALVEFSELGLAISKIHAVATFDVTAYP